MTRPPQDLKQSINTKLGIPMEQIQLSKNASLLTSKDSQVGVDTSNIFFNICHHIDLIGPAWILHFYQLIVAST